MLHAQETRIKLLFFVKLVFWFKFVSIRLGGVHCLHASGAPEARGCAAGDSFHAGEILSVAEWRDVLRPVQAIFGLAGLALRRF